MDTGIKIKPVNVYSLNNSIVIDNKDGTLHG